GHTQVDAVEVGNAERGVGERIKISVGRIVDEPAVEFRRSSDGQRQHVCESAASPKLKRDQFGIAQSVELYGEKLVGGSSVGEAAESVGGGSQIEDLSYDPGPGVHTGDPAGNSEVVGADRIE